MICCRRLASLAMKLGPAVIARLAWLVLKIFLAKNFLRKIKFPAEILFLNHAVACRWFSLVILKGISDYRWFLDFLGNSRDLKRGGKVSPGIIYQGKNPFLQGLWGFWSFGQIGRSLQRGFKGSRFWLLLGANWLFFTKGGRCFFLFIFDFFRKFTGFAL